MQNEVTLLGKLPALVVECQRRAVPPIVCCSRLLASGRSLSLLRNCRSALPSGSIGVNWIPGVSVGMVAGAATETACPAESQLGPVAIRRCTL